MGYLISYYVGESQRCQVNCLKAPASNAEQRKCRFPFKGIVLTTSSSINESWQADCCLHFSPQILHFVMRFANLSLALGSLFFFPFPACSPQLVLGLELRAFLLLGKHSQTLFVHV